MAETLLIFLTVLSLIVCVRFWHHPAPLWAMSLGLAVGFSVLCKPILLFWLPFVMAWWWYDSKWDYKKKIIRVALVFGSLAAVILPWTIRNYILFGDVIPVSANIGINLLIGNHPGSEGIYNNQLDYLGMYYRLTGTSEFVEGDRLMGHIVWGWFVDDPVRFLFLALSKLAWFWGPWIPDGSFLQNMVAFCSSIPVLVLGSWGTFKLRKTPAGICVGLLMIGLSILHVIFFAHTRFRLPVDACLCAMFAWTISNWLKVRVAHEIC